MFLLLSVEKRKLGLIWRKPPLPPSAYFNQNGIEDRGKKNQMHGEMIFTRREVCHGCPETQDRTHLSTFHILVLLLHAPWHTSLLGGPPQLPSSLPSPAYGQLVAFHPQPLSVFLCQQPVWDLVSSLNIFLSKAEFLLMIPISLSPPPFFFYCLCSVW